MQLRLTLHQSVDPVLSLSLPLSLSLSLQLLLGCLSVASLVCLFTFLSDFCFCLSLVLCLYLLLSLSFLCPVCLLFPLLDSKVIRVVANVCMSNILQDSPSEAVIQRDVNRTFPAHDFFKESGGLGQDSLYRISKVTHLWCVWCVGCTCV